MKSALSTGPHDRAPLGFLRTYADTDVELQRPMDAAVIIPTVLRPHLAQALCSVFAQDLFGRIHILIGNDTIAGDLSLIEEICQTRPPHCVVQVIWLGYSTAIRQVGLTRSGDGGALRATF